MEDSIKNKIISLKEQGKSIRVIAEELNINRGSVDYIIKNYNKNKTTMTDNKTTMTKQENYDKITMTAEEPTQTEPKQDSKTDKNISIGEDIFLFD